MIPTPLTAQNMTWAPSLKDSTGSNFVTWNDVGIVSDKYTTVIPRMGECCFLSQGAQSVGTIVCKGYFNGTHFGTKRGQGMTLENGYSQSRAYWAYAKPLNCALMFKTLQIVTREDSVGLRPSISRCT